MKAKHTPGPWRVKPLSTPDKDHDPVGVYQVEPAFRQLSKLYWELDPEPDSKNYDPDFHKKVHGVNKANARLISAAPDLLAALQAVADYWEGGDVPADIDAAMRAALKKAKGTA